MKIILSRKLKQMASALLVVMILGGILCMFVMYYLSLIEQQNTLGVRSQAWNLAITVTEAGIEEGLQALNSKSTDGWTQNGTLYWLSRTLPDGSTYTVTNNLSISTNPVITARSYIQLPVFATAPSLTMFATVASPNSASLLISRAIKVTCGKNPASLFTAAMVSKHTIDLNGNGVSADSFDSADPAKSTNGKWDPSKYSGDFGDVATIDSLVVSVQNANVYGKLHTGPSGGFSMGPGGGVGTHAWQTANGGGMQPGYFLQDANFTFPDTSLPDTSTGYLPPTAGNIAVTTHPITSNSTTTATLPNPRPWGTVTTNPVTYTTSSTYPSPVPPFLTSITNWVRDSWTLPIPVPAGTTTNRIHDHGNDYHNTYNYPTYTYRYPITFTYTYNLYITNTVVVTNHYDNVLYADHNYVSSALNGSTIVLGPNVKLVLPNGLSGAENLYFNYTDNTSPGLTVYAGGTSASISGNQYINPSGFAGSLIIYCAPTVTSFTLNGNGQFTGVLVAPNADLAMNGGGNIDQDFSGSLMVNSVRMNGHFRFHWDESLGRMYSDNYTRFLVRSWNEIP